MTDVSNEKEVKKNKKKWELVRETELEDIKFVLQSPQGRRFMWKILSHAKLITSISHHDPYQMAINSGARDEGLWLLGEIDAADKQGYMKIYKESLNG